MKHIALLLSLSAMPAGAATIYVGDSIAHGYKIHNGGSGITRVGAPPKVVSEFIYRAPRGEAVILSTGASNDCTDTQTIVRNINSAVEKYGRVYLLNAPYCGSVVARLLTSECKGTCKLIRIKTGPDGIHPARYDDIRVGVGQ
jgi:hypothetical protein